MLDKDQIDTMKEVMGDDFEPFMTNLSENMQNQFAAYIEALEVKDYDTAYKAIHSIKGSFMNKFVPELGNIVARLHDATLQNDGTVCPVSISELDEAIKMCIDQTSRIEEYTEIGEFSVIDKFED